MSRKRLVVAIVAIVVVAGLIIWYPHYRARQDCMQRVQAAYANADRVLDQPADLDGFCAAWNNHPPGY